MALGSVGFGLPALLGMMLMQHAHNVHVHQPVLRRVGKALENRLVQHEQLWVRGALHGSQPTGLEVSSMNAGSSRQPCP